jgi:hypothetical protein
LKIETSRRVQGLGGLRNSRDLVGDDPGAVSIVGCWMSRTIYGLTGSYQAAIVGRLR